MEGSGLKEDQKVHMDVEGQEEDLVEEVGKKISDIYIYCSNLLPWILLLQLLFFWSLSWLFNFIFVFSKCSVKWKDIQWYFPIYDLSWSQ
jgi:hypothetical protein